MMPDKHRNAYEPKHNSHGSVSKNMYDCNKDDFDLSF